MSLNREGRRASAWVAPSLAAALGLGAVLAGSDARADDAKRACVAAAMDGQTLRKQDHLLESRARLLECASDKCPDVVRARCTHWLGELDGEIPSVIVRVTDAAGSDVLDVDVSVDGQSTTLGRAVSLDPGKHSVLVRRAGTTPKSDDLLLVDGQHARIVTITLPVTLTGRAGDAEAASVSHGSIPVGAWVLGGVGVAALGSFVYFYGRAASEFGTLKSSCAPSCSSSAVSPLRTDIAVMDVSLGVSLAAVAGAVTWGLLGLSASKPEATHGVTVDVEPVARGAVAGLGVSF